MNDSVRKLLSDYSLEINAGVIDNDMKCIICKKLMIEAYQSICGCQYCHNCISNYLRDGDRYCPGGKMECYEGCLRLDKDVSINVRMNQLISQVMARCPHGSCQSLFELRKMEEHMNDCSQRFVRLILPVTTVNDVDVATDPTLSIPINVSPVNDQILIEWINALTKENNKFKQLSQLNERIQASLNEELRLKDIELYSNISCSMDYIQGLYTDEDGEDMRQFDSLKDTGMELNFKETDLLLALNEMREEIIEFKKVMENEMINVQNVSVTAMKELRKDGTEVMEQIRNIACLFQDLKKEVCVMNEQRSGLVNENNVGIAEERGHFVTTVSEMRNEMNAMKEEIVNLGMLTTDLHATVLEMKRSGEELTMTRKEVEKERKEVTKTMSEVRDRRQNVDSVMNDLVDDWSKMRGNRKIMMAAMDEVTKEVNEISYARAEITNVTKSLENETNDLKEIKDSVTAAKDNFRMEKDSVISVTNILLRSIKGMEENRSDVMTAMNRMTKAINDAIVDRCKLMSVMNVMKNESMEVIEARVTVEELRKENDIVMRDIKKCVPELKENREDIMLALKEISTELNGITEERGRVMRVVNGLKNEVSEMEEGRVNVSMTLEYLRTERDKVVKMVNSLTNDMTGMKDNGVNIMLALNELKERLNGVMVGRCKTGNVVKKEVIEIGEEEDDVTEERHNLVVLVRDLWEDMRQLKADKLSSTGLLTAWRAEMTEERERVTVLMNGLKDDIDGMRDERRNVMQGIEVLMEEVAKLGDGEVQVVSRDRSVDKGIRWASLGVSVRHLWKVDELSSKVHDMVRTGRDLVSEPFYLDEYCFRLHLFVDGDDVALWCYLLAGVNDHRLLWPLRQPLTLSLVDQGTRQAHTSVTFQYDSHDTKSVFGRPTAGSSSSAYVGTQVLARYSDVRQRSSVLVNDSVILTCALAERG